MKYRSEIDGLRALAVTPVILFHAGIEGFRGGFVGVDIFFVISGYLITTILISEKQSKSFSLLGFYERRARRILPALFVVMTVSLPLAWSLMTPSQLAEFMRSVAATVLFISNVHFWEQAGYFGPAADLQPLLHTWSLAIEEQYYLLFPLILLLLGGFKHGKYLIVFVLMALLSLAVAEWGSGAYPEENFFFTFSRFWELLAGSICAVILTNRSPYKSNFLSGLGLFLILIAIFFLSDAYPYPSRYTLIPVIGASLIILFAGQATWVARLLSLNPMIWIGLISYSAYLWHQPLFAFARIQSLGHLSAATAFGLVALTFVLSVLTWRYVEQPFRRPEKRALPKRAQVFLASVVSGTILFGVGFVGDSNGGWANRLDSKMTPFYRDLVASTTGYSLQSECSSKGRLSACSIMPDQGEKTLAVFGDSHATAILPAFVEIAEERGFGLDYGGQDGCPPFIGIFVINGNHPVGVCNAAASAQLAHVKQGEVDTVVLVGRWSLYTAGDYEGSGNKYRLSRSERGFSSTAEETLATFEWGLRNTLEAYAKLGVRVVLLDQLPEQLVDPRERVERAAMLGKTPGEAEGYFEQTFVERRQFDLLLSKASTVLQGIEPSLVEQVSVSPYFEHDQYYSWYRDGRSLYSDQDHISVYGAQALSAELSRQMFGD